MALLRQSQQLGAESSQAVVKGVSEGWNPKRPGTVREADKKFLTSLASTISPDNRERYARLMQTWGLAAAEQADPNVQVIRLKVVREALQFDKKEFSVKAGKPVEVVLENPDAMQHNFVLGKQGTMDKIGQAADKMITQPDAAAKITTCRKFRKCWRQPNS